jgi:uncharacterized protein (DUF1800 family)
MAQVIRNTQHTVKTVKNIAGSVFTQLQLKLPVKGIRLALLNPRGAVLSLLSAMLLQATPLRAEFRLLWEIGTEENPVQFGFDVRHGFAGANRINDPPPGEVTRLPGDPQYNPTNHPPVDDDFYLAGFYPAGFNRLTSNLNVPNTEPNSAFKCQLLTLDQTNRIHFILDSAQAGNLSRLRLGFELDLAAFATNFPFDAMGEWFGNHDVVVRLKNTATNVTLMARRVERRTAFRLEFNARDVKAQAGPNTIEFVRAGPEMPNGVAWITLNYVKLEAQTNALEDADADGLPRWWEEENHLSDNDPADAVSDSDRDSLTALQEYNGGLNSTASDNPDTDWDGLTDGQEHLLGTNPLVPDTDGDGITDGAEAYGSHPSNPLLTDSDGDGISDSLELRLGTDPMNPSSPPAVFRGGIGIQFVSDADPDGTVGTNETAGIIPQTRWNATVPMRQRGNAKLNTAAIASPVAGKLVRSDGMVLTNLTLSWTADGNDATYNGGSPDLKLMDGFIRAEGTNVISLILSNIPFARYDLYVFVGGSWNGQHGRVRLNGSRASDRNFRTMTAGEQASFVQINPGTNFQYGNFIRYAGQSSRVAKLSVTNCSGTSLGIHALQLVDASLDADRSGIPDWWEMTCALEPGSAALAAADSDGDGLTNLQEFRLGTDPHNSDTDGDGLTDGREKTLYTNPLKADTDRDGLSDGAEVHGTIATNPRRADTDGDRVNDYQEGLAGTSPVVADAYPASNRVPSYRNSSWDWTFDNVQLVWNHATGGVGQGDDILSFSVKSAASADWRTLGMDLRNFRGALGHAFHSANASGFSYPGQPGVDITDQGFAWGVPDLTKALGFSGFGTKDISHRLRFQMRAKRATTNSWTVTFEIRDLTSNRVVIARSFTNCHAAPALDRGTNLWTDFGGVPNRPSIRLHQGLQIFFSSVPLEKYPAFADAIDSDKDGMTDVWEAANGFNKFDAADATQDADGDGLGERDEFLDGTDPRKADTDGDGIPDGVELAHNSNPLDANSKPDFAGQGWPSARPPPGDPDTDGDGVPDPLETMMGSDPNRADSIHSPMAMISSNGVVTATLPGDYAAFAEIMGDDSGILTRSQAARLLQQASFGVTPLELDRARRLGFAGWINDQITNQPPTLHRPYIEHVYANFQAGGTDHGYVAAMSLGDIAVDANNCSTPFARGAIGGPDQLRQRMAFALSQIVVVSRRDPALLIKPLAVMDFYDIFVRNAFGNYYDILREATFHPVMGRYLSHVGNEKAHPEINQYPDENYAREIMQLFSIGLWELNPDGTRKLDGLGQPIPTYHNADITELARVFTGLWFPGQAWGIGGGMDKENLRPMQMWPARHDFGSKKLLRGFVVPERLATPQNGVRDVEEAVWNLFQHPNTPPFICKQLIQFFVTSNPSTNYLARVAAKFVDDGTGRRGNLGAVIRAILLDQEARDPIWCLSRADFGRLKDPVQRAMAMGRAVQLMNYPDLVWWNFGQFYVSGLQDPTAAPTVFNFYRPDYQPPGLLTDAGLMGPAFQITDSYTAIAFPNKLWEIADQGFVFANMNSSYSFPAEYSELLELVDDPPALLDEVNLLFCGGFMNYQTRDQIISALSMIAPFDAGGMARVKVAVYLAATCPEGAVQR